VPYVRTLRYGTLRIDTYGSTLRYGFLRYVTLREGGKQALGYVRTYGTLRYGTLPHVKNRTEFYLLRISRKSRK